MDSFLFIYESFEYDGTKWKDEDESTTKDVQKTTNERLRNTTGFSD